MGTIPAHAGKTFGMSPIPAHRWDYPRSRGENDTVDRALMVPWGLSPLTRGKLTAAFAKSKESGTIPAHAGKTFDERVRLAEVADYPRSRGENTANALTQAAGYGLSPLTRGKRDLSGIGCHLTGTIPAHAGKTRPQSEPRGAPGDYPRSRGENRSCSTMTRCARGLSPLTRGKPIHRTARRAPGGTIPAHAGKTVSPSPVQKIWRDYPRSRGENRAPGGAAARVEGLSPLTRGKPRKIRAGNGLHGTIPAHAGKTSGPGGLGRPVGDYPRSRGENLHFVLKCVHWRGLSPLTRGKPHKLSLSRSGRGTIPAHAGKTHGHHWAGLSTRDYPRSRGENYAATELLGKRMGLSPLTRGKLDGC